MSSHNTYVKILIDNNNKIDITKYIPFVEFIICMNQATQEFRSWNVSHMFINTYRRKEGDRTGGYRGENDQTEMQLGRTHI